MKESKKLIAGGCLAVGGMLVAAACVVGAGIAKADVTAHHMTVAARFRSAPVDVVICRRLDAGVPFAEVASDLLADGYSRDRAAWLIADAVTNTCPWQVPSMRAQLAAINSIPVVVGYATGDDDLQKERVTVDA